MSMISIKLVGEIFCGTSNRSNTSDTNDTYNAVNSSHASKTNTSVTRLSSFFAGNSSLDFGMRIVTIEGKTNFE